MEKVGSGFRERRLREGESASRNFQSIEELARVLFPGFLNARDEGERARASFSKMDAIPGSTKRGEAPGSSASSADISPFFLSPPRVFCARLQKSFSLSIFIFPFVFISGIQSAQRKDITKEGKRAQRRSGRRSTRERALEILQVRGLLPRPPPPLSSPAPPPRFPSPPPAPPIPAGTARADTTPAGALGCCCRSRFSGGARGGGSCGATRAVPALDGSIEG